MLIYFEHGVCIFLQPTQSFAFFGPFSTSSSYHVARTFATAKGMVIKMTSHFPRRGLCNAFDAKLLSDYPEEQEWLIGFCYVRILKFETRQICDCSAVSYDDLMSLPIASIAKEVSYYLSNHCRIHIECHVSLFVLYDRCFSQCTYSKSRYSV